MPVDSAHNVLLTQFCCEKFCLSHGAYQLLEGSLYQFLLHQFAFFAQLACVVSVTFWTVLSSSTFLQELQKSSHEPYDASLILSRVKAPNADPRSKADLFRSFGTFCYHYIAKICRYSVLRLSSLIGFGYFDCTLLQKNKDVPA